MSEKVVIISAPSGAGKTTVVKHLLKVFPQFEFSISACNREKRENEVNGVDYYFISTEEFRNKLSNNEFVEWEEVYENSFYGTLRSEVERIWKKGNIVIFDVDVKGGINLKRIFGNKALSIFISPPDLKTLEQRLRQRSTEDEKSIEKRVAKASLEMQFANNFDKVLINNSLNETLLTAETLIKEWLKK